MQWLQYNVDMYYILHLPVTTQLLVLEVPHQSYHYYPYCCHHPLCQTHLHPPHLH